MWSDWFIAVAAVLTICITHWVFKWRNPTCNGTLPPGSMGLPLIGETLQLLFDRTNSLDLLPFVKCRIQRYGPIFRTSLVGKSVIVSADLKLNQIIFQQEGKSVEMSYMDSFAKIFNQGGDPGADKTKIHKYLRGLVLSRFGSETLKEMLPQIEQTVHENLDSWSSQGSIDIKRAISFMALNFAANKIFGYDPENSPGNLGEMFCKYRNALFSLPLNIPGTAFHECMKVRQSVINVIKDVLKARRTTPELCRGDLLDQAISDMNTEKFLSEDFIASFFFGLLLASFDSVSTTLTLAFQFLAENPSVIEELKVEHERILQNRENPDAPLTWEELKSMTFTTQVLNETLRLFNGFPGLFRKALKDIEYNGYTIPAGWTIVVATSALQLNPDTFEDPVAFNPWRWKGLDPLDVARNFMPFGRGTRQCVGSEFSKVIMATFLHVLVTKYRWTKVKGGNIFRNPFLVFGDSVHIKVSKIA